MGITIFQWNANSLTAHIHEFKHFLDEIDHIPDVICIQETFLKPNLTFSLPGFSILRKDGQNGRGGVAICVKSGITYSDVFCYDDIEGMSVQIDTISGPLQIFNFYVSPSNNFDEAFFQQVFDHDNVCICGDFNAKSTLWGSQKADTRGKSIENILTQTNMVVLNTGTPTRTHRTGASHIDLTFSSPRFSNLANWEVLDTTCGSDHNLIKITYETYVHCDDMSAPKWLFGKADWPKFSSLCDSFLSETDLEGDLDNVNEGISDAIIRAAEESIPQSSGKGRKRFARFWNDKCESAIKERDKARRKLKIDSPDHQFIEFKRLKAVARKTIKSEKRKSWRSYCSSLSHRTKLSRVWNTVKSMNNTSKGETIPTLKTHNKTAESNTEKANVFADHYAKVSSTSNYSKKFQDHKKAFEYKNRSKFRFRKNDSSVLNIPFKMSEFKKALKKCKNTSPGKDRLCYEMFKHMSSRSQECILNFYNRVWEKGSLPKAWKHALIIPILKPNKKKDDPASYRPIALTSNFCKLMERMVVIRLNWFFEKFKVLNICQSGFRKTRNTIDQLLHLSDDIIKGFGNRSSVLGVFIDFEKAYDMVWRKGVLYKLDKIGLNGNVFNWISAFLSNRSLQVRVGNSVSDDVIVENGVPQGSVISPLLFLIAINDINPTNVKYSLFADDTAIWKTGRNIAHLQKHIQQALDSIQEWCDTWGFKISTSKTTFVLFHRGKHKTVNLFLNNQQLTQSTNVKFLGMIFDQALTWHDHIDYLIARCQKRINILKLLTGSKWGADKQTMVILYKTLIRPILDYGCGIYNSASLSLKNKLDVIQSQCLRLCCGALRCTPVAALEVDCGIPPLAIRRKFLSAKLALRYKFISDSPAGLCIEDCYQLHYGKYSETFKPFILQVGNTIDPLPKAYVQSIADSVPPWIYDPPLFDTNLHTSLSKKNDNSHFMLSMSLESMEKWSNCLQIFTDGSKSENKTACAFYVPRLKFSQKIRLPDGMSVYMAEMVAILESLRFILSNPCQECVIFSDSLSAIQSIESGVEMSKIHQKIRYCFYKLYCQGTSVTITWVPSHVDIKGNEAADKLAKQALSNKTIDYPLLWDISDLYQMLEDNMITEWQTSWDNTNKGRFYHQLEPKVANTVRYTEQNREKQTCLTRLRFGKCLIGDVLHVLGKRAHNRCNTCDVKEDVSHFLLHCMEYQEFQVELNDKLLNANHTPSIGSLLGNSMWYEDVWKYVLKTKRSL